MQVAPFFRQQTVDRRALKFIVARANQTRRLVERHVKLALRPNRLAVRRYPVVDGINPGAQLPNRLAIDRHPSGQNHLLAGAPRGDTRFRQEFLQANHPNTDCGLRNAEWAAGAAFGAADSTLHAPQSALAQTAFLVLRKPVMRSPAFHWPRFSSNSTRS